MYKPTEDIDIAEQAHRQLRSPPDGNLLTSLQLLTLILPVMNRARAECPRTTRVAARIAGDAEWIAGESDDAGFRNDRDLWASYTLLRQRVAERRGS